MDVSGHHHVLATLPPGRTPGTHWVGEWVGLRAGLDAVAKRTVTAGNRAPVVQPVGSFFEISIYYREMCIVARYVTVHVIVLNFSFFVT